MTKEKKCDGEEFYFIGNGPDETGAIIVCKKCHEMDFVDIADLPEFLQKYPDTKVEEYNKKETQENLPVSEDQIWAQLLQDFPSIVMCAPLHEPERMNYIMGKLKTKYKIGLQ